MSDFMIEVSQLDEMRFGIRTAKAQNVTAGDISAVQTFCREHDITFVHLRVPVTELKAVQMLEADGYRLMDTLVYHAFKYKRSPIPDDTAQNPIRSFVDSDADAVTEIAHAMFQGYFGHYHADPRLDNADCDAVYVDWATRSVQLRSLADEILVVEDSEGVNAFVTLRMNTPEEGECVLGGVIPRAQGQGIYQSMIIKGMHWVQAQGAKRMVVSTQITNVAVQKVWARLGFEMHYAYYTLHKWYDDTR